MEHNYTQLPWETTMPDFQWQEALGVVPQEMSIVTVTQRRLHEVAEDHVRRVEPRITDPHAREGFVRGAGMFSFDVPGVDLDDLLG